MKQKILTSVIALGLLATACTAGGTATITEDIAAVDEQVVEPTSETTDQVEPTAPPAPTAVPEPTPEPAPTATPTPVPLVESLDSPLAVLEPGDCFNNAGAGTDEDMPGPAIDCDLEHEYEVFFVGQSADGPDVAFRSGPDYTDGLFTDFCDAATIEFAGAPWNVLPFDVIVWTASESDWIAGDRSFACTAQAGLPDENSFKIGSAAGGNLASDEGIVARSVINGQRDFFFSFQGSTLYPLTNGEFELPNQTPDVFATGFVFSSPLQDVEGAVSRAFDYEFASDEVTGLVTGLEGWEIVSPHFVVDIPAFVFAARETAADDWDIYRSGTGEDPILLTESADDDHWLTVTPDESQIVYNSGGDIWIMNVDGTDRQQLTSEGSDFESAVSPDGSQVVFASSRSGNDDIWIMDIDGSNQRNLTNHPANDAWPFFSTDGSIVYFQTDRLGVRSNIMMMEPDGSNQSYYSFEFMTNAAVLPDNVTARFIAELPSLAEVLETSVDGVVPGAEGEFAEVSHSSGLLTATVPAGWEFQEIASDDEATLLAAASTSAFNTTWSSDGVLFTVVRAATVDEFTARLDAVVAATDSSCVEQDRVTEVDGARSVIERSYNCGSSSQASVLGIYESGAQAGLMIEGQWDGDPSTTVDREVFVQIAELVRWG